MSHHRTAESQPPPVSGHGHRPYVPPVGTYVPPQEEHLVPLRHSATEPMPNITTNPAMSNPSVPTSRGHPYSPDHAHSPSQRHGRDQAQGRSHAHNSDHAHSPTHAKSPYHAHKSPTGHNQSPGESPTHYSRHPDVPFPIPHTKGDPALAKKPPPTKEERKRDAKDGGMQDHAELALEGISKVLRALDA